MDLGERNYIKFRNIVYINMPDWCKIKDDPVKRAEHNEKCKNAMKKKYDTDPAYREYMREKARKRKAMLREQKMST